MLLLRPQGIFEVVKRKADLPSSAYREKETRYACAPLRLRDVNEMNIQVDSGRTLDS
jgi:hypothetical protein